MKNRFTISILLFLCLLVFAGSVHAQLLEDTDRKLRTIKTERKFRLFKKKVKRAPAPFLSFGKTSSGKTITPTSRIPFSGRVAKVPQRSSPTSFKDFKTRAPRLSVRSPFSGQRYKVRPRFSVGLPFTGRDLARAPRYSGPSPFAGQKFKVYPRFSGPRPFTRKDYPIPPRYSAGMPFTKRDFRVNTRYSPGSPFAYRKWKVRPKYTGYMSFNLRRMKLMQSIFPNRYISSFLGKTKYSVKPDLGPSSIRMSKYMGPLKLKPVKPGKNLHPSYRYKKSVFVANENVRSGLRKWNIFWTGFARNSESPKGVRKKASKPKFDRKEREIWNN